MLRGIAIFLVLISHYAVWIGEIFHSDLLEYGLGRFGVYGVDLFFVVSGYGLVKSVGKKRINGTFLWKRFKTVYLPYLLIVGLITVYDGGISGMTGWVSFLTGAEYWYIRNILVFYLAFYVVYRLSDRSWVRMLLMAVCLTAYSGLLIWQGRALFWYISNVTFLFGMLLAQYERQLLKAAGFLYPLQLLALAVGMYFVIKTELAGYTVIPPLEEKIRSGLLAGLIWTYLMVQGCAFLHEKIRWLEAVGSFSLELYLCHMFVFYRVVNDWLPQQENVVQIVAAVTIAVALAWVIHMLFDLLWKAAATQRGRRVWKELCLLIIKQQKKKNMGLRSGNILENMQCMILHRMRNRKKEALGLPILRTIFTLFMTKRRWSVLSIYTKRKQKSFSESA